jgi:AcrR family transcriptional regulator
VADADLLEAARRAFTTHGWAGATLERIAAEAGLSRVTLHRRGVTKDALLAELVARGTEDYRRAMWPALTGDGSGAARLERALAALCDQAEEHMALLVALRAQSHGIFHTDEEQALTRTVFTEPLEKLLREGAADGSLRASADPLERATVLFNLVSWTYFHLRTEHGWPPERARRATLDPVLHGVLAIGARRDTLT